MKPVKVKTESAAAKTEQAVPPPPPPPPPPVERFWVRKSIADSITKQEISRFWRQKRIDEEDHLLAAIKAAARLRACNLPEEEYKQFVESLKDEDNDSSENNSKQDKNNSEVRVGMKDWWTKSKYAYLNQPAIGSMDTPRKRTATHIPNCFTYKPVPVYPSSLGVF